MQQIILTKLLKLGKPNRMILQMIINKIFIDKDKIIRFDLKTDIEKLV